MGKKTLQSTWPSMMGLSRPHVHSISGEVLTHQAASASLEEGRDRRGRDRGQGLSGSLIPPPTNRRSKENTAPRGEEVVLKASGCLPGVRQSTSAEARWRKVISP